MKRIEFLPVVWLTNDTLLSGEVVRYDAGAYRCGDMVILADHSRRILAPFWHTDEAAAHRHADEIRWAAIAVHKAEIERLRGMVFHGKRHVGASRSAARQA